MSAATDSRSDLRPAPDDEADRTALEAPGFHPDRALAELLSDPRPEGVGEVGLCWVSCDPCTPDIPP